MSKKIILIAGIVIVIGIAAFLILGSRQPVTQEGSGFSIRDYLPFGRSSENTTEFIIERNNGENQEATSTETAEITSDPTLIPKLRKISNEPVAGAVIWNVGTTSLVRFVEKGTGNVYEARSDRTELSRLTNTTIPKIVRALWLPDGSGFLAQTLQEESEIIETSLVKLNKNKASTTAELTPYSTTISKLPVDIKEITIKPDGTKIFYYTVTGSGSAWFISNPDGTAAAQVYSSPLTEWIPKWIAAGTIVMQSKASSEAQGYAYTFNVATKTLRKTGVGLVGLAVNPNSDNSLILASKGGTSPQLMLITTKNGSIQPFSAKTLAEKCVWSKNKIPTVYCAIPNQVPAGNYPDVWYKGLVSTADFIGKIDANDIFSTISNLSSESKQKIDVSDLKISSNETQMIFTNKIDGMLWMLRIEG